MPFFTIPDRLFSRFVVTAVGLGFLTLVIAGAAAAWLMREAQYHGSLVAHTYNVEVALLEFIAKADQAETRRRGFLVEPDERFVEALNETVAELDPILDRIAALTRDNPAQQERVRQVRALSDEHVAAMKRSIERKRTDPKAAVALLTSDGSPTVLRQLRDVSKAMTDEERRLLGEREDQQRSSTAAAYVILGLTGLLLAAVAAGTIWAILRSLRELRASRNTLRDLNEDLESAVRTRTADLQRANDEIQRFAYIVSHDLRSPLVNVMGFTSELDAAVGPLSAMIDKVDEAAPGTVSEDARLAVKEDLPEAIGFIRSSTEKMDRLINAILRLSREGRRVMTPERLDMAALTGGIVASLQHHLDRKGAEVSVDGALPAVVSDRVAVEQILSNLIENAVKYLKPGRAGRVTVRGRREGERVLFEVEDNGRGIDPKDHERVFDLFRRSGAQDQPGEGIGLAHVRALAYRLGGFVSCESALDRGATFRLSMPAIFRATKEQSR